MVDEPIAEKQPLFQRLQAAGHAAWQGIVDLVTPPLCLTCRARVSTGAGLCMSCWRELAFIEEPVCAVLGTPFAYYEGEGAVSPAAIANPPPWDMARACVAFDDSSKQLVHLLKYRDVQEAGLAMARMMTGTARQLLPHVDIIMPVPLHRRRLWRRRFNQAAYLAQHIASLSGKPWTGSVLMRVANTSSQVGMLADERRKNVQNAFAVAAEKRSVVDGRTILLVDDVRTTGATAAACASALKKAGAARVYVLTFALVLEPARLHIEA